MEPENRIPIEHTRYLKTTACQLKATYKELVLEGASHFLGADFNHYPEWLSSEGKGPRHSGKNEKWDWAQDLVTALHGLWLVMRSAQDSGTHICNVLYILAPLLRGGRKRQPTKQRFQGFFDSASSQFVEVFVGKILDLETVSHFKTTSVCRAFASVEQVAAQSDIPFIDQSFCEWVNTVLWRFCWL